MCGHIFLNAFVKPVPPSETTILGSAIRFIRAIQAPACSYLHKYHPKTFFSSQQIRTHALRPRYMPSRNKTSRASSIFGGIGQISQNFAVFLLNVRPFPGISDCACFPNNHSKNICNSFDVLSILCVKEDLHFLQSQRCVPALVLPDLTHLFPQTGQFT